MTTPYEAGQIAHRSGLPREANPHTEGTTKLGNPKLSESGIEWDNGWLSCVVRRSTTAEIAEAAHLTNVGQFKRKSNRYYSH